VHVTETSCLDLRIRSGSLDQPLWFRAEAFSLLNAPAATDLASPGAFRTAFDKPAIDKPE
jgi:hypothetical protein